MSKTLTGTTKKLLSGNEAVALGAYHAGIMVAAAYPGTPSTEILENLAKHHDLNAEWATNEKVAMEIGIGSAYAGRRTLVSMKHIGLNVAVDPFMAAAITGVNGGLVIISADDPGIHSSQDEQDNRHYAPFAKVPMIEPSDSQEAYDMMAYAFSISEEFDTPAIVRLTTRIAHSNSLVEVTGTRKVPTERIGFEHNVQKYVMLPVNARFRRPFVEDRLVKLAAYTETFPFNKISWGDKKLGIITSGVSYQYAREVFHTASFLKLGMTYPPPKKMIREFCNGVDRAIVIEELDPFLQDAILAMGIAVTGKEFIPRIGELNTQIVREAAIKEGLVKGKSADTLTGTLPPLPGRPPLLCPGCPHSGVFYTLNILGKRSRLSDKSKEPEIIVTGDIGCYTLATYPPLYGMDTADCMGASIGTALGIEKANIGRKVVAVIGDSTFLHSGITGLVDAVYNNSKITVIILDNSTTAMTGHQEHPGTGKSAKSVETQAVDNEQIVRGLGVKDVQVVDAFDLKALRNTLKSCISNEQLSVVIVRGDCPTKTRRRSIPMVIDYETCTSCETCLKIGCPAIQKVKDKIFIEPTLCIGDVCSVCRQVCPHHAIEPAKTTAKG
ncbi:MAG TPA: indolepyruvate ferredoxin oxidoreductase subunit alpha [Dehalococcoidia bacterium]|nr:indolepyruvate ferredoxin oxidoreductase subunit alpha [Dehalococcoidia bacterium]